MRFLDASHALVGQCTKGVGNQGSESKTLEEERQVVANHFSGIGWEGHAVEVGNLGGSKQGAQEKSGSERVDQWHGKDVPYERSGNDSSENADCQECQRARCPSDVEVPCVVAGVVEEKRVGSHGQCQGSDVDNDGRPQNDVASWFLRLDESIYQKPMCVCVCVCVCESAKECIAF